MNPAPFNAVPSSTAQSPALAPAESLAVPKEASYTSPNGAVPSTHAAPGSLVNTKELEETIAGAIAEVVGTPVAIDTTPYNPFVPMNEGQMLYYLYRTHRKAGKGTYEALALSRVALDAGCTKLGEPVDSVVKGMFEMYREEQEVA